MKLQTDDTTTTPATRQERVHPLASLIAAVAYCVCMSPRQRTRRDAIARAWRAITHMHADGWTLEPEPTEALVMRMLLRARGKLR